MESEEISSDQSAAGPDDILVFDLRRRDDFEEFHVKGVVNVPFEINFIERVNHFGFDKRRPIFLLANSSQEARMAERELLEAGYSTVRCVVGGCKACSRVGIECVEHCDSTSHQYLTPSVTRGAIAALILLLLIAATKSPLLLLALVISIAALVYYAQNPGDC